ncbi:MAG: molybdopterin-dependent oxidoreductase [Bacillota bacterium]|nr:molybdopterin-dependent oxidoreductase [Bacillota bacterium]HHU42792.1 molybdopterin-dependent oxidoreductase [Clostridiales bacterium]
MKKILIPLAVILVILLASLTFAACDKDDNGEVDISPNYTLEIFGIKPDKIVVTKAQIMEIAETKSVIYDENKPCYASDKTDKDNNPIPHTLKGVYLDDILEVYADGAVSASYSAMRLRDATGDYENVITSNVFNEEHGGTKMIVAYEYDGHILNKNEPSGALRAVFPNQAANTWVKMLKQIEFTDAELKPPAPSTITFMELLGEEYYGSFEKQVTTESEIFDYTYYGISLDKLFEAGLLNADQDDKMYIIAWDFISDGTNSFYREYTNWKSYEYYRNAFLAYSYSEDSDKVDLDLGPVFNGENISKGMSVKNTLAISVKDTALMSLDIAFERFDTQKNDKINLLDLLTLMNIHKEDGYRVFDKNNNHIDLTLEQVDSAYIEKTQSGYVLRIEQENISIYKISVL